jgi:hypothetical protein
VNKKRYKEWLESSHLDEIRDFEDEFLFDKTLTFKEKSILLKSKVNLEPFCKYCNKEFKAVGKYLLNHEAVCPFNPKVAESLTISSFKSKILKSSGVCPKCNIFYKKLRLHANYCFSEIKDFAGYLPKLNSVGSFFQKHTYDVSSLSELPFFSFDGSFTEREHFEIEACDTHIEKINAFKSQPGLIKPFILLFLNINSIFNKVFEVDEILNKCNPDAFLIDESKLDSSVPKSWYTNKKYFSLRLDRVGEGGGGNLVFLRQGLVLKKYELTDFETIYFQLMINGQLANFLLSYKSPSTNNIKYLEKLENFLMLLDPSEPLFIVGDLNMDLLSNKGNELKEFLLNNQLKNSVMQHTRVCRSFFEKKNKYITSKSLIDVVLHNQNLVKSTEVIGCPFNE